jgi:LysM repeat protein
MTQPAIPPEQPQQPEQPEQPVATPIEGESLPVATPVSAEPTLETIPTEAPAQEQIHTVQAGDTLGEIAAQYGVTVDEIVAVNEIPNVDQLAIGQQLIIPVPGSVVPTSTAEVVAGETPEAQPEATSESASAAGGTHVVQLGENLYRIGLKYGCSVDQMAAANGIVNPSRIAAGQVLQIPDCN